MEIRLLGPLEVTVEGSPVAVGGPRLRRLLVALVLANGAVRSIDLLIEAVWAEEASPPSGARRTLMSYVSRLRSLITPEIIEQVDSGYRLRSDRVQTDVDQFAATVVAGAQTLRAGNAAHAEAQFDEALRLWRGQPLTEFAGEQWVEPERVRLGELRLAAIEGRFEAKLSMDGHAEVLADLERVATEEPDRDRLQYLYMLALYRSGRQVDALRRFQIVRSHLADLGLEAPAELRDLEHQILVHDERLLEVGHQAGTSIRGYQLRERIGEGSFGTIYRAVQPSVNREVAIKVIRAELANDAHFIRRFETEAQLVARLEHPHIVPLYDYWREPGGAYLVMRCLRGGSAEDRLVAHGPLPLEEVARIIDQIGGALAAAHARGVIHRDVRPANILFDDDGDAYLADFGIAVGGDNASDRDRGSGDSSCYASPEQMQRAGTTNRSDIYSLGIGAYHLLTGRVPYSADSVRSLVAEAEYSSVPSVRLLRPELPAAVDDVIQRATVLDPVRRFADMGEMVLAFRLAVSTANGVVSKSGDRLQPEGYRSVVSQTLVMEELARVNPYKGLRAFQEADSQDFYGREDLIAELVRRVASHQLVAIVGASGSGKSSVVRAGLIPSVADRNWLVVTMVPGAHPFEELEAGLLRIASREIPGLIDQLRSRDRGLIRGARRVLPPDGGDLLLVIDQFEELFTAADAPERDRFLDRLVEAVLDESSRIRVVVTIRADFYDRPLQHRGFATLLQNATVNLSPMTADALEAVIESPARRLGVGFEPGLVDAIVADAGESIAMLPLLQYALTELYDHRVGDELTLLEYRKIGGVTGALARRAEELYNSLTPQDQDGARRLFLRLVTPGEGVEDTRRRALRSELAIVSDDLMDRFGSHRLLSFDHDPATRAPTVEVAHEALIREWQRFRQWVEDDRDGLRTLRHLTTSSKAWNEAGKDPAELYRGGRLDSALEWADGRRPDLAAEEVDFLDASREFRENEVRDQVERAAQRERQNLRLRRTLTAVGVLAVVALIAGGLAFQQSRTARASAQEAARARFVAETRRLISDAGQLAPTNRRVALLLAAEAYRREPGPAALGGLQAALTASTNLLGYVASDLHFVDVAWTDDGRLVGAHPNGFTVTTADGNRELFVPLPGARLIAVGPTNVVAVATSDSSVQIFSLESGEPVTQPLVQQAAVTAMAFSADGSRLAIGDQAGMVRIYDDRFQLPTEIPAHVDSTQQPDPDDLPDGVEPPLAHDPTSFRLGVLGVSLSSDGRTVASVGGSAVRAWDVTTGRPLLDRSVSRLSNGVDRLTAPSGVGFVELDGVEVVASSEQNSVELWSTLTGDSIDRRHYAGGSAVVQNVDYRLDVDFGDHIVATVSGDGRVRTASADSSEPLLADTQLGGRLVVAIDEERGRLAVAGPEGAVLVSTVGSGLISKSVDTDGQNEFYVSNDGSAVIGATVDTRPISLWRLSDDRFRPVPVPGDTTFAVTGLPQALGIDLERALVRERDPVTLLPFGPVYGPHPVFTSVVSPDERWIAFSDGWGAGSEGLVRIYERSTGRLLEPIKLSGATSLDFSPDNRRLVVSTTEGVSVIYDTESWQPIEPQLSGGEGAVVQAKFTPDGRHLVTASSAGTITVRDASTLQPDGQPLLGNTDSVEGPTYGPHFSPDSRWMVTMMDGEIRLWDLEDRVLVGRPFPRDGDEVVFASHNARHAITILDGRAVIWELQPDRWPEIACQAAGRNLTVEEWEQFGPAGEPYSVTCPQWPSLEENEDKGGGS